MFGAGHGKTMVKDCLIGSQATAKQALLYSLVTTIAHTASIFVLGLLGLFASRYIVPEQQLYAILSFLSGCTICGVGFWLLASRFENKSDHSHHHGFPEKSITPRSLIVVGIAGGICHRSASSSLWNAVDWCFQSRISFGIDNFRVVSNLCLSMARRFSLNRKVTKQA